MTRVTLRLRLFQVITPCFLEKKKRFSVEEGIRNRGVASTRYVVEVVYARVKAWTFLANKVRSSDFHETLNYAWWWALGFNNLQAPLKPPPAGA